MAAPWGIGTDILLIDRIRRLKSPEDPFFRKAFTPAERELAARWPDPILFYATRFCAKEAVFKALRVELTMFNMNQIEIGYDAIGRPTARLLGPLAELAEARGIGELDISISYDQDYAVAVALAAVAQKEDTTTSQIGKEGDP